MRFNRTVPLTALLLGLLPVAARAFEQPFPTATAESQGIASAALTEIQAEVESYVERDLIVGGELLIIQNRRTVLHETFGFADREREQPWTRGTVANVRSMTKPLTGAAAQILIDRGQLAPGDPAASYLPGFDSDRARQITVGQILAHRAGLPLTVLTSMDQHGSLIDMGNAVGARGPRFEPDSRFWYSDSGTDALGAIVEVASGQKLDHFVREQLLEPLGMSESFYFLDDGDDRRKRIASVYFGGAGSWKRIIDPGEGAFYPYAWGSQSLYSTPMDYARFLAMWMDGGQVGERRLLSRSAIERTLTPISEMTTLGSEARFPTSFSGLEVYYGQMAVLHVPLEPEGERRAKIVGHSGSDGTIAWAWPERDLMVLFFTQSRGGSAVLRLEKVLDRLLIAPELYTEGPETDSELEAFTGIYVADWSNHMKEEFVVHIENGRLAIDVPSQMDFELAPGDDEGTWTFAVAPEIRVWFERDEHGTVNCLRIQQGPLTFEAPRQGTPHQQEVEAANRPDASVVGKLVGLYDDPESEEPARVFVDGDYLAIAAGSGEVFHLWKVPIDDVWTVRENPMFIITFQEEGDVIESFTRRSAVGGGEPVVFQRLDG